MADELRIPWEVANKIGYYVYVLRDPRDGQVFYVGKGKGERIASHVREARDDPATAKAKARRINEIEASGLKVELLFLRTGIDDETTAFAVEQAVIDSFAAGKRPLTNLVKGHDSGALGLATLPNVVARYAAKPCPALPVPVIMVKIQNGWRPDMSEHEVYEKTRGNWKIAPWVRDRAEFCLGVAYGVVQGAYAIDGWFESEQPWDRGKDRWGFRGVNAPELQHVVGTHVRDAFPNQVMYRRFLDGYPGSPGLVEVDG